MSAGRVAAERPCEKNLIYKAQLCIAGRVIQYGPAEKLRNGKCEPAFRRLLVKDPTSGCMLLLARYVDALTECHS